MNKVACFIIGTNAVGKSTLARQLIETFGGVERVTDKITYCKDGETCFLGKYFHGGKLVFPYDIIVRTAKEYINTLGGFERFAEWGLIR